VIDGLGKVVGENHEAVRYIKILELIRIHKYGKDYIDDDEQKFLQWRDLVEGLTYSPFGMTDVMNSQFGLDNGRNPWLDGKDIAIAATLPNQPQILSGVRWFRGQRDSAFNKVWVETDLSPKQKNGFVDVAFVSEADRSNDGIQTYRDYLRLPQDTDQIVFRYDPISPYEFLLALGVDDFGLLPFDILCGAAANSAGVVASALGPLASTLAKGGVDFLCGMSLDAIQHYFQDLAVTRATEGRVVANELPIDNLSIMDIVTASSAAGGFASTSTLAITFEEAWPKIEEDSEFMQGLADVLMWAGEDILDLSPKKLADSISMHLMQLAPKFSFANGKVSAIREDQAYDFDDWMEAKEGKRIANNREIRMMDGGYNDNTSAVHAMSMIQKKLSDQGLLSDALCSKGGSNASCDPTFKLTIFPSNHMDNEQFVYIQRNGGNAYQVSDQTAALFGMTNNLPRNMAVDDVPYSSDLNMAGDFRVTNKGKFLQKPSVQLFDKGAWDDADLLIEEEFEFKSRGRIETDNWVKIWKLDVVTVNNPLYNIAGGQAGEVYIIETNNPAAMNAPVDEATHFEHKGTYDNVRELLGNESSTLNPFDWNVVFDLV